MPVVLHFILAAKQVPLYTTVNGDVNFQNVNPPVQT